MYSKTEIAWYIVKKLDGNVSHLKLQKLLYYIYSWSLVSHSKSFSAQFEAWKLGPVEKEIYFLFKEFGDKAIGLSHNFESIPSKVETHIDFIIDSYKPYSAVDLSLTTHAELPWISTKLNDVIPDEKLFSFYSKQAFASNFPLDKTKVYTPPSTHSSKSFSFDMKNEYLPTFDSIESYLKLLEAPETSLINSFLNEFKE